MERSAAASSAPPGSGERAELDPGDPTRDLVDPLGHAVSATFVDLAAGRMDRLEFRFAPHRHPPLIAGMIRLAGRDPACTSRSEISICVAVLVGFAFTAAWQVAAVVIAGRVDLGVDISMLYLLAVGAAVAFLVVLFDWHMIHSHVHGHATRRMWLTRVVFTLCMVLLVSEVAASAVFAKDIEAQAAQQVDDDVRRLEQRRLANRAEATAEGVAVADLNKAVDDATAAVLAAEQEREKEEKGFLVQGGRGDRWHLADQAVKAAEQALGQAQSAVVEPTTGVAAHQTRIAQLDEEHDALTAELEAVREFDLGPAQREAALWAYLREHPSALFLKRIPLSVVIICLDLFALIIGLSVARRTRQSHLDWEADKGELAKAARFVRARVLQDAKTVIGRLVTDGLAGLAEQRSKRARQRRAYRAAQDSVTDRAEHEAALRALGLIPAPRPEVGEAGVGRAEPDPTTVRHEDRTIDLTDATVAAGVASDVPRPTTGTVGTDGSPGGRPWSRPGAASTDWTSPSSGSAGTDGASGRPGGEPGSGAQEGDPLPGRRRRSFNLPRDPAEQSDDDVAEYLGVWYGTDAAPVRTYRRLPTAERSGLRATLLVAADDQDKQYVVKIFSCRATDDVDVEDELDELNRDAVNARRMTSLTGGLADPARGNWLAPSHFGRVQVGEHAGVPYLVTPYYPSGSVLDYIRRRPERSTLDWCLRLSEQMFLACAQLAENRIVGCDAKLANFVFAQGAYFADLSPEQEAEIGLVGNGERSDPVLRLIDLSVVYFQEASEDPGTRAVRGTPSWSSPRAMSGGEDDQPLPLTSLDDAYTVAVNSMYLLSRRVVRYGSRVELEALTSHGPSRQRLIELSSFFSDLADNRISGPGPEHMLVRGQEWISGRGQPESAACIEGANYVAELRAALDAATLRTPFDKLRVVPSQQHGSLR